MIKNDQLELDIQNTAVGPRVTPFDVEEAINSCHFFTAREGVNGGYEGGIHDTCIKDADALKLLTFCVLVLKNGFTVTGESACAYPENYNREIGEKIARENAKQKIWGYLGYELKTKLMNQN